MAVTATLSFSTAFDLTLTPKQIVITDSSTAADGITNITSALRESFVITAPSGTVIYNNTDYTDSGCDIDRNTATTNQHTIALPVDGDGIVETGEYTIVQTAKVGGSTFTLTKTYTYVYASPEVEIIQTVKCTTPVLFTSVDDTNYTVNSVLPTISRSHVINYPYGSAGSGSPVTVTTATSTTSTFYNGTQTTVITSGLTYVFTDGLTVIDAITGSKEILVDCTYICAIYCCIRSVYNQMVAAKGVNNVEYLRLQALDNQITSIAFKASLAISCGKSEDVNGYLSEIKNLANCTDDCSCSGDEPSLVIGY